MSARRYDVLILGGGAAGLAAARLLKRRGKRALIVEGRARLGGRMWTDPGSVSEPLPLELGAEFVHGPAPVTERLCREAGLTLVEVPDRHVTLERGRPVDSGAFWGRLARAFARIPAREGGSFEDYARRRLDAGTREAAARFVESFHGAAAGDISALSLRQSPEEFERSGRARRILGGYGALVRALGDVPALLNARVEVVAWKRDDVRVLARVNGRAAALRAPRCVVTLPLGVLQAGLIRFSPRLAQKEAALDGLGMGHALRVSFSFSRPVWEKRLPSGAFWHAGEAPFPVWWSSPLEGRPAVTAWCGGPAALERVRGGMARAVSDAAEQLAQLARVPKENIFSAMNAARTHDWTHDIFTFGAYSHARVKGNLFFSKISEPIARTLFFAGEHAISDGEHATVEGALRSGEECVKKFF